MALSCYLPMTDRSWSRADDLALRRPPPDPRLPSDQRQLSVRGGGHKEAAPRRAPPTGSDETDRFHQVSPDRERQPVGRPAKRSESSPESHTRMAESSSAADRMSRWMMSGLVGAVTATPPAQSLIEPELVSHLPGDDVVSARRVTAHPQPAEEIAVQVVEGEPTAEDIHATDELTDQRIVRLAVLVGVAAGMIGPPYATPVSTGFRTADRTGCPAPAPCHTGYR